MSTRAAIYRMSETLCHRCRIPSVDAEDLTAAIFQRVRRRRMHLWPAAIVEVRRYLAKRLDLREDDIPMHLIRLIAIGEYEKARAECKVFAPGHDEWDDDDERITHGIRAFSETELAERSFDMHSRRFAIENGVCPRCSLPGRFTEDSGRCQCGFAISPKHRSIFPTDTNESKPARRKKPRMAMRGPDCHRAANPRRLFPKFTHDPKSAQRKEPRMEMRGPN